MYRDDEGGVGFSGKLWCW